MSTSIMMKIGGINERIVKFVLSVMVAYRCVPAIWKPSSQATILSGACGTWVSTPPTTIAMPRLGRTRRVKKASTIARRGGTTLYHMAC